MIIFQYLSNIIQIYSIILVIYALLSWFPGAPQSTLGGWRLGFYGSCSTFGLEPNESAISSVVSIFDWLEYDGTERDLSTFQSRRSRIY